MTNNITIKHVTTEDEWQQMKILLAELLAFEKSLRPQRKDTENVIHGAFRYVRENITARQGAAILALDNEGKAIGFINGWLDGGDGLDADYPQSGSISDAYVVPLFREQGVFKKLNQAMATHFKSQGVLRMETYTLGNNLAMQEILKKAGFTPHKVFFEIKLRE